MELGRKGLAPVVVLGLVGLASLAIGCRVDEAGLEPSEAPREASNALSEASNALSDEEEAAGWRLLFDGSSLDGWQSESDVDWAVTGGVIQATRGEVGLLHTTEEFADFELKVDFRAARGTNSGIFLRSKASPTDVLTDCYELNIAPASNPFPTGSFVGRHRVEGAGETDHWRSYEVSAVGGDFEVRLDGGVVLQFHDDEPIASGVLGLQFNQGSIEFRNVKIRPLGSQG